MQGKGIRKVIRWVRYFSCNYELNYYYKWANVKGDIKMEQKETLIRSRWVPILGRAGVVQIKKNKTYELLDVDGLVPRRTWASC